MKVVLAEVFSVRRGSTCKMFGDCKIRAWVAGGGGHGKCSRAFVGCTKGLRLPWGMGSHRMV